MFPFQLSELKIVRKRSDYQENFLRKFKNKFYYVSMW